MSFPDGPLTGAPVGIVQPGAGGPVSLQAAYNVGNTIVTAAGRVVSISGPEDVSVSSTVGPASASVTTTAGLATILSSAAVRLDTGTGLELEGLGAGQIACASPLEARTALGGAFQNVRAADPLVADDLVTKRYVDALPSGITPSEHETLRQLIHFIDDGPGNGFATGAFKQTLPAGVPFPTSFIWWESAAMITKIVELQITRNANQTPASETWTMYSGGLPVGTVTDTIVYAANVFEVSRTRAIAP